MATPGYVRISSDYACVPSDRFIECTGSGSYKLILPLVDGVLRWLTFINSSSGKQTIVPQAGENIMGANQLVLMKGETARLLSNGVNWVTI